MFRESFLCGLDQISFLAILAKDMGLALLFTMHYWRWLFINLNQVLWCCFAGAFQAWYAHGDRHSHPLQPSQCCLPSEAWIHTGKYYHLLSRYHLHVFTNISNRWGIWEKWARNLDSGWMWGTSKGCSDSDFFLTALSIKQKRPFCR